METTNNQQSLHLPHEIIEEILSRLPVQSLLKFRCVSKSWRCLIEQEEFIKKHHQKSLKNPSFPHQRIILNHLYGRHEQCSMQLLLNDPYVNPSPLFHPTNMPSKPFEVVGCYNGLVCILEQQRNFYMWNPSTRVAKKLPEVADCRIWNFGFGCFESSDEYMVFAALLESRRCIGKVYSSKTKMWKTIGQLDYLNCSCEEGKFVSGKLHWFCRDRYNIVTYDFKSEVCGMIMASYKDQGYTRSLVVIGGCLCMLYYYSVNVDQVGVRVWVMKEYGVEESWERVATPSHVVELLQRPCTAPFVVGKKGEVLVLCGSDYLIYYPKRNVFHRPNDSSPYVLCKLYVESLVSPDS